MPTAASEPNLIPLHGICLQPLPAFRWLGLEEDATPSDVNNAFRKLSRSHHPDRGGDVDKWKLTMDMHALLREKKDDDRLELDGWPAAALRHQVAAMGGVVLPAGAAHGALASAYWEALKAKGWERDADKRRWLQLPAAESAKPEAAAAAWLHLLLDMEVPEAGYDEKKDEGALLQAMAGSLRGSLWSRCAARSPLVVCSALEPHGAARPPCPHAIDASDGSPEGTSAEE